MEVHSQGESQRLFAVGGLSIRDYFAAMALSNLAAPTMIDALHSRGDPKETARQLVAGCYAIADAMLVERSKP
jgi:hypothetical protein